MDLTLFLELKLGIVNYIIQVMILITQDLVWELLMLEKLSHQMVFIMYAITLQLEILWDNSQKTFSHQIHLMNQNLKTMITITSMTIMVVITEEDNKNNLTMLKQMMDQLQLQLIN